MYIYIYISVYVYGSLFLYIPRALGSSSNPGLRPRAIWRRTFQGRGMQRCSWRAIRTVAPGCFVGKGGMSYGDYYQDYFRDLVYRHDYRDPLGITTRDLLIGTIMGIT